MIATNLVPRFGCKVGLRGNWNNSCRPSLIVWLGTAINATTKWKEMAIQRKTRAYFAFQILTVLIFGAYNSKGKFCNNRNVGLFTFAPQPINELPF